MKHVFAYLDGSSFNLKLSEARFLNRNDVRRDGRNQRKIGEKGIAAVGGKVNIGRNELLKGAASQQGP